VTVLDEQPAIVMKLYAKGSLQEVLAAKEPVGLEADVALR
jgi:hypothetical protein